MINRFIIAGSFAIFASAGYAENNIVNTGSESGGFNTVLSMIADNMNTNVIQAGNPVIAASHFEKPNVLTMWSTEWPGDTSLPKPDINGNTIVALQTYETIMCSRQFTSLADMDGMNVKVATWGDSPSVDKFLTNFGKANNVKFNIVPYEGSGGTTRGYLGGDADTIFTIQTRQAKVETDGTCFAFSAEGDLDFAFIDVILSVNASSQAVTNYRNTVSELAKTEAWKTTFDGTVTYIVDDTNMSDIVAKTNVAIQLNTN